MRPVPSSAIVLLGQRAVKMQNYSCGLIGSFCCIGAEVLSCGSPQGLIAAAGSAALRLAGPLGLARGRLSRRPSPHKSPEFFAGSYAAR